MTSELYTESVLQSEKFSENGDDFKSPDLKINLMKSMTYSPYASPSKLKNFGQKSLKSIIDCSEDEHQEDIDNIEIK